MTIPDAPAKDWPKDWPPLANPERAKLCTTPLTHHAAVGVVGESNWHAWGYVERLLRLNEPIWEGNGILATDPPRDLPLFVDVPCPVCGETIPEQEVLAALYAGTPEQTARRAAEIRVEVTEQQRQHDSQQAMQGAQQALARWANLLLPEERKKVRGLLLELDEATGTGTVTLLFREQRPSIYVPPGRLMHPGQN